MKEIDPILEMYIFESTQMIEQTEAVILDCELANQFSEQAINEIFRNMHTLKGSSAMMQYMSIANTAHAIEDLFHVLREQQLESIDYSVISDVILQSVDFLKSELQKVEEQRPVDGDPQVHIEIIHQLLQKLTEEQLVEEQQAFHIYHAIVHFAEDCAMENVRAYQIVHQLQDIVRKHIHEPQQLLEDEASSEHIRDRGFHLVFETTLSYESIHELLMKTSYLLSLELYSLDEWPQIVTTNYSNTATDTSVNVNSTYEHTLITNNLELEHIQDENQNLFFPSITKDSSISERIESTNQDPLITTNPSLSNKKQSDQHSSNQVKLGDAVKPALINGKSNVSTPMISVHVEKLDRLMDLVGELVIAEAMIHNSEKKSDNAEDSPFVKAVSQLRKITSELQDTAMSIRMIPLTGTFNKMRRVSRDMSRKLKKELEFVIIGEETEIDKTVIDQISDPLMHLVRNAIDHGIESTDLRLKHNKPSHGTIVLEARNIGSDVLVMVKDDGKGLNKQRILEKAIQQGVIQKTDAEMMSDRDIFNLIFQPGLSTQDQITEFSGRGVGMDVVASNIQQVGGVIYIDSEEGTGTTVTMKIPLTLAIIDGMNVKVSDQYYTIPIHSITESFRPKSKDILVDPNGNPMIMVRGECYPILSLHKRFQLIKDEIRDFTEGILIMIEQEDVKICIFVDELLGQQQVVIKPLPTYLRQFGHKSNNALAGCTLLGDGSISLILNMAELTGVNHHSTGLNH